MSPEAKRKCMGISGPSIKSLTPDLFIEVFNRGSGAEIDIHEILEYILICSKSRDWKNEMLLILKNNILLKSESRGKLNKEEWSEIYILLKIMIDKNPVHLVASECFMLLIKWGPASGLLYEHLRGEFSFVSRFCQKITECSPFTLQTNVVEITLYFCEHTAKDNRISCCKFGEEVLPTLIKLYNGKLDTTGKALLIRFFLLQLTIHHPNSINEDDSLAYAQNLSAWKKHLITIYDLLTKDINTYLTSNQENNYFIKSDNGKLELCENFLSLFIMVSQQVSTLQKSPKIKIYIQNIRDTKSWLWIRLVGSIIKNYPKFVIEFDDYIFLLQILSEIQIKNNEYNITTHLYFCLLNMLSLDNIISSHRDKIIRLWKCIGDTAIRDFTTNQHKSSIEKLFRDLINKGIIDFEDILDKYKYDNVPISYQTVITLDAGLQFFVSSSLQKKELIMNAILRSDKTNECEYLRHTETARFLVKLTLKQYISEKTDNDENKSKYNYLNELYLKTCLNENTLVKPNDETILRNITDRDIESVVLLASILREFVINSIDSEEILFSKIILLTNVCSFLTEYGILTEESIKEYQFIEIIENVMKRDNIRRFPLFQVTNEEDVRRLINCIDIVNILFTLKISEWVMDEIKGLVSKEFLCVLYKILINAKEEQVPYLLYMKLRGSVIQACSSFACISGNVLNQFQKETLELLTDQYFYLNIKDDCELMMIFLKTVKLGKPGMWPNSILDNILVCIRRLASKRFYDSGECVLEILSDFYPYIAASVDNKNKSISVNFLTPFFENLQNSGPNVSISLLKCIEALCKVDPENTFSQLLDKKIIKFVPEFLKSDYLEVRFKAVDVLVTYFKANTNSCKIEIVNTQTEVFKLLYEVSFALHISRRFTSEREKDEIICNKSSILITFISIASFCDNWMEESLYCLLKVPYVKGIEYVNNAFNIINKHKFGNNNYNILEKCVIYLVEKWLNDGYPFDDFPHGLYNCKSKYEFYKKYFDECAYFLILNEVDDVKTLSREIGVPVKVITKQTAVEIFCRVIISDIENLGCDILEENKILSAYSEIVGIAQLTEILTKNLDKVVIGILDYLIDRKYIADNLEQSVIFFNKCIDVSETKQCFEFIQVFLCDRQLLGLFLTDIYPLKLENILLQLKEKIYTGITVNDQVIHLHRYTFFVDIITEYLKPDKYWRYFFIRDVVYTLLNLIENNENCNNILFASCRYLELFLEKILPQMSQTFKLFLNDTITSLKAFYYKRKVLATKCKNVMSFLIVKMFHEFKEEIKKLSAFPDIADFHEIRFLLSQLKYKNKEPELEDQIIEFLNSDLLTKEHGLVNLRNLLSSHKSALLDMCDKLQDVKKFSEKTQNSTINRLVCSLSQLSCSTNQKVSFEAARCLGELGPVNLQTLALQPENHFEYNNHPPYVIILEKAISFLSNYIIDCDVKVSKIASQLLYIILSSTEARKIIDSTEDFITRSINKNFLVPFVSLPALSERCQPILNQKLFLKNLANDEIWCNSTEYNSWIIKLVSALLEDFERCYLVSFTHLCKVKVEFSEYLLPLVLDLIISLDYPAVNNLILSKINYFFDQHWKLALYPDSGENSIAKDKKSLKSMLNVLNYVRKTKKQKKSFKCKVGIDYLKVAKAAESTSNYFSVLYYSELWCRDVIQKMQNANAKNSRTKNPEDFNRLSMIDNVYENIGPEIGEALFNMLRNAYRSIGDLEGLSGCGTAFLHEVENCNEFGKFNQVMPFYQNKISFNELRKYFKNENVDQIPLSFANSDDPPYECMWRLSQWSVKDTIKPNEQTTNYEDFDKYNFFSLKALHNKNLDLFGDFSKTQFLCIINYLKNINLGSSHIVYPILSKLQSLIDMEDFPKSDTLPLIDKWKAQDQLNRNVSKFEYVEPIIAQRLVMLTDFLNTHKKEKSLQKYICDLSLDFADWAKDKGHYKESLLILDNLKRFPFLSNDKIIEIDLLEAQLSWLLGDTLAAEQILERTINKETLSSNLYSLVLKIKGQQMSEAHLIDNFEIISGYFLASIDEIKSLKPTKKTFIELIDTYEKLADYALEVYQQIMQTNNQRMSMQNSNAMLKLALKCYLQILIQDDKKNIHIFQVFDLFLKNRNNRAIKKTIQKYLPKVPSYKFITILPQLISHLSETNGDFFSEHVKAIVLNCACKHPYHTLPLLLSLANTNYDESSTGVATEYSSIFQSAGHILEMLNTNVEMKHLKNKTNKVLRALIDLAIYTSPDEKIKQKKEFKISIEQPILNIRNFDEIVLPTSELAVSLTSDYSNFVGISHFKPFYQIAEDLNLTKRIFCRGTDGKLYPLLLITNFNYLRQEAVIQEVFKTLNKLLSCTLHLRIRTFKILSLSMTTAVLECIDNNMSLKHYLTGKENENVEGAHQIYRPGDRLASSCKKLVKKVVNLTPEIKLSVYRDICEKFRPVFYHFFEESFSLPAQWYERRIAYINSVATTSMCGYILGVGDRKTVNILIDKETAEVIHIDFRTVFEQAKPLHTPEIVPFRLTRDIVDGMGVSGVEGIFKKSCEKTMEVLRQNSQTIISILEVLFHDPLNDWTSASSTIPKEESNLSTERALLRLRERLQGSELGNRRSIEDQVGTLIQTATDPESLSRLPVPWEAYV